MKKNRIRQLLWAVVIYLGLVGIVLWKDHRPRLNPSLGDESLSPAVKNIFEQKAKTYGFDSSQAMFEAMRKRGKVHLGDPSDRVVFDFGEVSFETVKDWHKEANVEAGGSFILLRYTNRSEQPQAVISLTRELADQSIRSSKDYSEKIRQLLTGSVKNPSRQISEPRTTYVAGHEVAILEFDNKSGGSKTIWYQVLIKNSVLTLKMTCPKGEFSKNFVIFDRFAKSMRTVLFDEKNEAF